MAGDVAWLAFFVAMPVLVLERFGEHPEILGWILGAWGLGAVLGSAVMFRVVRRVDGLLIGSIGELAMIAPLWLFLPDLPAWALVVAMFASGLANGLVNAPIWTIFTVRTPPALRPKAWAAIIATTSLLGPLVLLAAGSALDSIGLTGTLLAIVLVQSRRRVALRERRPAGALSHRSAARDGRGAGLGTDDATLAQGRPLAAPRLPEALVGGDDQPGRLAGDGAWRCRSSRSSRSTSARSRSRCWA